MLGFLTLPVSAAEGTIQIQMPDELKGSAIHYHINGEPQCADIDENGRLHVNGLETDTYYIRIQDTQQFAFMDMEIPVPMWDEEDERMEYDITVIPKYSRVSKVPETGDSFQKFVILWCGVAMLSVAGMILILAKKK